jgi:hypothetical protein
MEARQFQCMAEEKQQYDQESLAMLQDILVEKDKEVYALEEELRLCKIDIERLRDSKLYEAQNSIRAKALPEQSVYNSEVLSHC